MSIYEEAIRLKNAAITGGDVPRDVALQVEVAQALLAMAVGNYKHAMISLISAASLSAKLAGLSLNITQATPAVGQHEWQTPQSTKDQPANGGSPTEKSSPPPATPTSGSQDTPKPS